MTECALDQVHRKRNLDEQLVEVILRVAREVAQRAAKSIENTSGD